jgi:hypothetical protein
MPLPRKHLAKLHFLRGRKVDPHQGAGSTQSNQPGGAAMKPRRQIPEIRAAASTGASAIFLIAACALLDCARGLFDS